MGSQTIDYDKLAAEHGGTAAPSQQVDYDALAAQHGGTPVAQPQQAKPEEPAGFWKSYAEHYGVPTDAEGWKHAAQTAAIMLNPLAAGPMMVKQAAEQVHGMADQGAQNIQQGAQENVEAARNIIGGGPVLANLKKAALGNVQMGAAVDPSGGLNSALKMGGQLDRGEYAGAGGTAAGVMTDAALGGIGVKEAAPSVEQAVRETAAATSPTRPATGPQPRMYPQIRNMPQIAVSGAEDIFRAAAPTGTNSQFRPNLYAAMGDLAEVGKKMQLDQVKGGIINPDMRPAATVKALNEHMADMYQTERLPQIQRNAKTMVDVTNLSADAQDGLRSMAAKGPTAEIRQAAQNALDASKSPGGVISVVDMDKLGMLVNGELSPLRATTAQERATAVGVSRKYSALTALDKEIGTKLNTTLKSAGETGLTSYERRYAALSEVRDQIQSRITSAELNQPGMVKGVVKPVLNIVTGGKSALPGAGMQAVADVNVGRSLESGFRKLAGSGLVADRTGLTGGVRQSPVPPTQTQ